MDVFTGALSGDLERVRALIEQDAGLVHATDHHNWTPLVLAALYGHVEVARYLLDHGARVNHRDRTRCTALHWACSRSHVPVVSLLLQSGADATAVDDRGKTPQIAAAHHGRDAAVRVLLEHGGSDVDGTDHNRWTACHWACYDGHARVLKQLLEAGTDPTLRDVYGRVARDLAANTGCVAVLEEWERAYTLVRLRGVRDAPTGTPPAAPPGL